MRHAQVKVRDQLSEVRSEPAIQCRPKWSGDYVPLDDVKLVRLVAVDNFRGRSYSLGLPQDGVSTKPLDSPYGIQAQIPDL